MSSSGTNLSMSTSATTSGHYYIVPDGKDGVRSRDLNCLQLVRLDLDILAVTELVAAALVLLINDVAGLLVDHLLAQPVAGLAVDLVKAGLLGLAGRRIERDLAGHEV